MKKLVVAAALVAAGAACTPDVERQAPPDVVVARFDPSASPPVVPSPNDLAENPATGRLAIAVPENASQADQDFLNFLNSLDGFPASSSGSVTFSGELDATTVSNTTIRVIDLTDDGAPVTGYTPGYAATPDAGGAASRVSIVPPSGGWKPGHRYAFAVIGQDSGVKGAGGQPVVAAATWAFIMSESSLVRCEVEGQLNTDNCTTATEAIPSTIVEDPAARLADQTNSAVRLEQLRLKYAPAISKFVEQGVERDDIVLVWSFKVASAAVAMVFDPAATPAQVPLPNDLAIDPTTGLVKAPVDPASNPTQQEFTADYLNTLDGFPVSAGGQAFVAGGDLDPATVNASTVLVLDITDPSAPAPAASVITYDATTHSIGVRPTAGTWTKGHRYAVAIVGGANGVKGTGGAQVIPSPTWVLARTSGSLVTCEDLTDASCAPNVVAAPLDKASALRLEQVRRGYAPLLNALPALNPAFTRENIPLLWTFKIVSQGEATFDPSQSIIPFPNDILRNPTTGKVNLPTPPGAPAALAQLIAGLNTLDGFSTTAAAVSENSDNRAALDLGDIDAATLQGGATGFLKLTPGGTQPQVTACLNCEGTATTPQQLQFVPQAPLDEKSQYGAYVTTGVKDTTGKAIMAAPAFALLRMANPLVDGNGVSQISGVPNASAAALEPLRQAMKPFFDALTANGLPRRNIALAWVYTTQTTVTALQQLHAAVGALPATIDYAVDVTAQLPTLPGVGEVWQGQLTAPFLLTGPSGTLDPTNPSIRKIPFILTLPSTAAPGTGYPVTIFGHGLGRSNRDMLAIASALAASGRAAIGIDAVFHGERSACNANAQCVVCVTPACTGANVTSAGAVCSAGGRCESSTRAATAATCTLGASGDATCAAARQGLCLQDGRCEGGDFLRGTSVATHNPANAPIISAQGFLSLTNFFTTRDNWRHFVADAAQVVRVVKATGSGSLNHQVSGSTTTVVLDGTKIDYVGQSLGGIMGTLFLSASPDVHRAVLNVPGGDPAQILLTSPAFASQAAAFKASLGGLGITEGTPAFDQFINLARWIMDPSDPKSAAYAAVSAATPADRAVLIQYINTDLVVPNPTTLELIAAANRTGAAKQAAVKEWNPSKTAVPDADRHGFLLNFVDPTTTQDVQAEAIQFLQTGTLP